MYDRNGLQLTPIKRNNLNSYRLTAVDLTERKYSAYARAYTNQKNVWSMYKIGSLYDDPRDAAFVAQEFEKVYDSHKVRQMVTDGIFYETARQYAKNVEIPEWEFPAEGLLIEDILNDYGYEANRVEDAKSALVEAYKVFQIKPPALKEVPALVKKVEEYFAKGMSYRQAARKVVEG